MLCLIRKGDTGNYVLTPIGSAVIECIKSIEFIEQNKNFFEEHGFGYIPKNLLKNIGCMSNSRFYYGIHLVFPKWSKIVVESNEFVKCIFSQPPILLADTIGPKVQSGLNIQILFDKKSKIPECNEFVNKMGLRGLKNYKNFEKKTAEHAQVNLIMSEKEACIIFPNESKTADLHGNFISNDSDFVAWCKEFFEYKWSDSEVIARLR